MDFCSVNATNHTIIPLGYNRVMRCVKPMVSVHTARTQAEIHTIASKFTSNILYVPKLYEVYDKGYETEFILHTRKELMSPVLVQLLPVLFVELFRFKDFMMKEGYFMRGITLCRIGGDRWAILDFSKYGIISKKKVKFPKDKTLYTLEQAETEYGIQIGRAIESKIERQADDYNGLYD